MERFEVWAEKYRPTKLADMINQKHVVERVEAFLKSKELPHMLFAGPPGCGKCVEEETPIALANGRLIPIKEVQVGDRVLCLLPSGKIGAKRVRGVIERESEVLKICTASGNWVKITSEHPFLVLENGLPRWKEAKSIKEGEHVATPLLLPIKPGNSKLELKDLKNFWCELAKPIEVSVGDLYQGSKRVVLKALEGGKKSFRQLSELTGMKVGTLRWAMRQLGKAGVVKVDSRGVSLSTKKMLATKVPIQLARGVIKALSYERNGKFSSWIRPPILQPELFEWLAYVLAEGRIENSRIVFYNWNPILLGRFCKLTRCLFGIFASRQQNCVQIKRATTLIRLLKQKFNVYLERKKSRHTRVPTLLFEQSNACIASFIRAYFDCDGSISPAYSSLEISSNSKGLLFDLKFLLLRFGITATIKKRKNFSYSLFISGKDNLQKFNSTIGSLIKSHKFKYLPKQSNTNQDVMMLNSKIFKYVLQKLAIKRSDLCEPKALEYLLQRGKGGRKKIQSLYARLVSLSRKKLTLLLEKLRNFELLERLEQHQVFEAWKIVIKMLKQREVAKLVAIQAKIGRDRISEYARGKRVASSINFFKILRALNSIKLLDHKLYRKILLGWSVRKDVLEVCKLLNLSFASLARKCGFKANWVASSLRNSTTLLSLSRIGNLICAVKEAIERVVYDERLISALEMFSFLSSAQLYWSKVTEIKRMCKTKVYDLEIEDSHNFIGGFGCFILHNTTLALIIARELYQDAWRQNTLELNASDERGIDVIRGKVKDFARTKAIGDVPYKLIILDEADALTSEAQQALRRTMESFAHITRFTLCCNYSSKIIEPIQSRTAVFRFKAFVEDDIKEYIQRIAKGEKLSLNAGAIRAIVDLSEGDLRKVANILQACAALSKRIDEDSVYEVLAQARPKEVKEMLQLALDGKFEEARKLLQDMLLRQGLSGADVIKEIHRQIYQLPIPEPMKVKLVERCGEYEFRLDMGANELIQLEALLANFLLVKRKS